MDAKFYTGQKVFCKYGEDKTGKILRKQGKNGYMVSFQWYKTFQDFSTLKLSRVLCDDKVYMKTSEIEVIS